MFEIAPSILSADFTRLGDAVRAAEEGGARILHVDVMDGHFVPNITIGLPVVRSIRAVTEMIIDTHLMIEQPSRYAAEFVEAGADMVSVHIEADPHIHRTLASIREAGGKAGIVVNPATSLSTIEDAVEHSDFVLLMSVNPGFGGQKFIPQVLGKVRRLKEMVLAKGLEIRIEIDGGIDATNVTDVVDAGADILVAGSAVYGQDDPVAALKGLYEKGTVWV